MSGGKGQGGKYYYDTTKIDSKTLLIPDKSRERYISQYNDYMKWKELNEKGNKTDENIMIRYACHLKDRGYAGNTIMSKYQWHVHVY